MEIILKILLFFFQVYWAGPLPAALITAIIYKNVFRRDIDETPQAHDIEYEYNKVTEKA